MKILILVIVPAGQPACVA